MTTGKRLGAVMASTENKSATTIQKTWRAAEGEKKDRMASRIQAVKRGQQDRQRAGQTKKVKVFTEEHAARVIQRHSGLLIVTLEKTKMMNECKGIIEKQGRKYSVFKWEV